VVESAKKLAAAKKFAEAAGAMKDAIRLAPRNDLYLALADDCEREAGLFADGLEHAQQAVKLNDKVGLYYALAATHAYGLQKFDLGRSYVKTVLEGGAGKFGAVAVFQAEKLS
jgi:tetratricopeptide (TPR) repeat protein